MKPPPQWIYVGERYPDVGQDVVYYFDVCGTFVGRYLGEHTFAGAAGFLTDDVTHWMPYTKPKHSKGSFGRGSDKFRVLQLIGSAQISAGKAAELLGALERGEEVELPPLED